MTKDQKNNRERISDYEGDTVIGKGHQGVIVTLVDRATRETKIKVLPNRKADIVAEACVDMLDGENPLSITFDNGKELAHHPRYNKFRKSRLSIMVYLQQ